MFRNNQIVEIVGPDVNGNTPPGGPTRGRVNAGHDAGEGNLCILREDNGSAIGHFPISSLRALPGEEEAPEGLPTTAREWAHKWADLVEASHRIADDHSMCSQFEANTEDLGIPPRSDLEKDYDFEVQEYVDVAVTLTVTVPRRATVGYTTADPDTVHVDDLLAMGIDWEDPEDEDIEEAITEWVRYNRIEDFEVLGDVGDAEITDWSSAD